MRNILNIVKKELDKIFKSPRLILSTFVLPGLLIFVMYSAIGSSAENQLQESMKHEYNVILLCESEEMSEVINNLYYNSTEKYAVKTTKYSTTLTKEQIATEIVNPTSELSKEIQTSLKDGTYDLWIYVDDDFKNIFKATAEGETTVLLFSHTSNNYSSTISNAIWEQLQTKQMQINPSNKYIIATKVNDVASDQEKGSTLLAMLAPMLIMTFIFAGALAIGADSIAGEKERGTIATMLMAPISKNNIVLGKIISAIIITVIAAICSFIGLMLALSQLTSAMGAEGDMFNFTLTFTGGVQILVLILFISLIAVSLFLVASTFAKSTKEASMYAMPVYLIGIISGVMAGYSAGLPTNVTPYIIPIYNLTLGLKGVFINNIDVTKFLIVIGSNIVYFVLILFLVRKMFNSEKIMFNK